MDFSQTKHLNFCMQNHMKRNREGSHC